MQRAIVELKNLGQMPDSMESEPSKEIVERYEELLTKVKTPLSQEEVEELINLFPESSMYEVEWSLLHLIETYAHSNINYRQLIQSCPSEEWRETMTIRLDNWEKKNKGCS